MIQYIDPIIHSVSDLGLRKKSKLQVESQGWRKVYRSIHIYIFTLYIPCLRGVTKQRYLQNAAGATAHLLN